MFVECSCGLYTSYSVKRDGKEVPTCFGCWVEGGKKPKLHEIPEKLVLDPPSDWKVMPTKTEATEVTPEEDAAWVKEIEGQIAKERQDARDAEILNELEKEGGKE